VERCTGHRAGGYATSKYIHGDDHDDDDDAKTYHDAIQVGRSPRPVWEPTQQAREIRVSHAAFEILLVSPGLLQVFAV
jgi:hypothetical protein